jgi:sugar/nucleoside kinase (ribokinase family)
VPPTPAPAAPRFDIVGIGNAIVDVVAQADSRFVDDHALEMGSMVLVDEAQADALYSRMGPAIEVSGGSCANTVAGASALGSTVAFIGKVADDALGEIFRHDLTSLGVHFDTPAAWDGPSTARCLIFVTPDAQRTMATYLGACVGLGPDDIDADLVASGRFVYIEGYLWDPPQAKAALRTAIDIAHAAGRKVAMTLSDPFCVARHRDEFRALVEGPVDILFANQIEAESLVRVSDVWDAVTALQGSCEIVVVTRGDQGSIVVTPSDVHEVAPVHVADVIDSTGAGDLYAAGFLHGLASEWDLVRCAQAGSAAAAEVIGHFGARPERDLTEVVRTATRQEGTG